MSTETFDMDTQVALNDLPTWLLGMIESPNPNYRTNYYTAIIDGIDQGWFVPDTWAGQGKQNFIAAVMETDEYRDNSESTREYLAKEQTDPATFLQELNEAKAILQREAADKGLRLPQNLDDLARQYLYQNWRANPNLMASALSAFITEDDRGFRGEAGDVEQQLKYLASQNGVQMSDGYFSGAVRSIASGLGDQEDYEREIREMAAGKFPQYSERIMGGENARDLASGYISVLSDTFELDPNTITLDNEYLLKGLMGGADGPVSLWDYRTMLRDTDYWVNETQEGRDSVIDMGTQMLERMGFIGTGGTY